MIRKRIPHARSARSDHISQKQCDSVDTVITTIIAVCQKIDRMKAGTWKIGIGRIPEKLSCLGF